MFISPIGDLKAKITHNFGENQQAIENKPAKNAQIYIH